MGSVWCKPSEMRDDCSPKLNIHSLISRLSSQMCPSNCRYPQTNGRSRTKPRPRSAVLSQGKRPEISPPLVHPIPPPRKKRKQIQEMSRSEEVLCRQEVTNPVLRASTSLPSVYDQNFIMLRNGIEIRTPMASIIEESPAINDTEVTEAEVDSLPPSEVYFLKKEEIPTVLSEAKSAVEIGENDEYLNNKKPMNDTFTAFNEPILTIEKVKEKERVIKNETKKITEEMQKSDEEKISSNKLNLVKDQSDIDSIKKWQDAMKKRWLQNILIEAEPKDTGNQVTVNGSLHLNTSLNSESVLPSEKLDDKIFNGSSSELINNKISSVDVQKQQEDQKNNKVYENIIKNTQEQIPKLLVSEKSLNETLERLQSVQSLNEDVVHNNRNLVFSSDNLNNMGNMSTNFKNCKEFNQDSKKDSLKLDINLEEKLNSNRNSRHSSITDSLQEFETSIYDMLQQSAKENISDEDDSLVIINVKNINNNNMANSGNTDRVETVQKC